MPALTWHASEECSEYLFEFILLSVALPVVSLWPVLRLPVFLGTVAIIGSFFFGVDESGVSITNLFEYFFGAWIRGKIYLPYYSYRDGNEVPISYKPSLSTHHWNSFVSQVCHSNLFSEDTCLFLPSSPAVSYRQLP